MSFSFNKLGDIFQKLGQSTLQTGVFLAATQAINSPGNINSSIFGCGSFGNYGGYSGYPSFGGGFGYNMSGMNCGFNMGYNNMFPQMDMMMPYFPQLALGQTTGLEPQTSLKPTNNEAAEKYTNHSTKLGELFEQKIKAQKDTTFVLNEWKEKTEGNEKDKEYKTYTSNFAKSYLAHMDKTAGNKDNELTLEEFTKYNELVDFGEDASEQQKAESKKLNETAFKQMDQNGDGKLDWKETAAVIGTYDSLQDGKHDGTITYGELLKASDTPNLANKYRSEYTRLFGQDKKE